MKRTLSLLTKRSRQRKHKKAIAEIIAALLLILISVAAAAVVYTYVLNFVGNVSQDSGPSTSQISIDVFCASASSSCIVSGSGTSYYIVVRNRGSAPIAISGASEPSLYFTDTTLGSSVSTFCNSPAVSVPPGGTYTCSSFTHNYLGLSPGDYVTVKVVDPDGGASYATTRALR